MTKVTSSCCRSTIRAASTTASRPCFIPWFPVCTTRYPVSGQPSSARACARLRSVPAIWLNNRRSTIRAGSTPPSPTSTSRNRRVITPTRSARRVIRYSTAATACPARPPVVPDWCAALPVRSCTIMASGRPRRPANAATGADSSGVTAISTSARLAATCGAASAAKLSSCRARPRRSGRAGTAWRTRVIRTAPSVSRQRTPRRYRGSRTVHWG